MDFEKVFKRLATMEPLEVRTEMQKNKKFKELVGQVAAMPFKRGRKPKSQIVALLAIDDAFTETILSKKIGGSLSLKLKLFTKGKKEQQEDLFHEKPAKKEKKQLDSQEQQQQQQNEERLDENGNVIKKERRGRKSKAELLGLSPEELLALKQKSAKKKIKAKNSFAGGGGMDAEYPGAAGNEKYGEKDGKKPPKGKPRVWQKNVPVTPLERMIYTNVCANELSRNSMYTSPLSSVPHTNVSGAFGLPGYMCFDRNDAHPKYMQPNPLFFTESDDQTLSGAISFLFAPNKVQAHENNDFLTTLTTNQKETIMTRKSLGQRYVIPHPQVKTSCSSCNKLLDHEDVSYIPMFFSYNSWLPLCKSCLP